MIRDLKAASHLSGGGVMVEDSAGVQYRAFTLLYSWVADHPESSKITCTMACNSHHPCSLCLAEKEGLDEMNFELTQQPTDKKRLDEQDETIVPRNVEEHRAMMQVLPLIINLPGREDIRTAIVKMVEWYKEFIRAEYHTDESLERMKDATINLPELGSHALSPALFPCSVLMLSPLPCFPARFSCSFLLCFAARACPAGRRVLTKTHKKMVLGDITDSVFRSYVLTVGEPAMSAMVLRLRRAGINTQVLQVLNRSYGYAIFSHCRRIHPLQPPFPLSCMLSTHSSPASPSPACFPPTPAPLPTLLHAFHSLQPRFPLSCMLSTHSSPPSPLLHAFHSLQPRFPLSCMLSTHSSPASPSPACFPPTPAPLPPLLHAFHPLQPPFPLSCMLSTHSSPPSPSHACFPPTPAHLPPLLHAFHSLQPRFPLSCMLSTHSSPASPSPACFPPTPAPLPPLLHAFHPLQPPFPLSCMLSTHSSPPSPSPACFPLTPAPLPPLLHAFHPLQPPVPLSCMLSTHSSPPSPSPACFPPTPAPRPPLLHAFHPLQPPFPLSCMLSTHSSPPSPSPACFPLTPAPLPHLLHAFHLLQPRFPLSCMLSTHSSPASHSPACFPPTPAPLPPLLHAFHPLQPPFPLSCMLSTQSSPPSPSPACFPLTPAPLPPPLHAFHSLQPRFPLSCMLSTHSSPASPSPACFSLTPAHLPPLLHAFHSLQPRFPLSCMLSTHSSPASPSPACFPPTPAPFPLSCMLSTHSSPPSSSPKCFSTHSSPWPISPFSLCSPPPLSLLSHFLGSCSWFQVHTALAIPPHDKMEWTSRGQFVKASPGEKIFSSVAINPAGKGSPWYGCCLVLFHYNKDGELRRGAYVEYYTEDKRLCPSTGCKHLLPIEGEDDFAVIDVDCILSLVHIVPSCEDDEVEVVFAGTACDAIRSSAQQLLQRLATTSKDAFNNFELAVASDENYTMPRDGTRHALTSHVVNNFNYLNDGFQPTMQSLFGAGSNIFSDNMKRAFAVLYTNLVERKSKQYDNAALSEFFLMNNAHYIVERVINGNLKDVVGEEWIYQQRGIVEKHAKAYLRITSKASQKLQLSLSLAYACQIFELLKPEGPSEEGMEGIARRNTVKEKFDAFNALRAVRVEDCYLIPSLPSVSVSPFSPFPLQVPHVIVTFEELHRSQCLNRMQCMWKIPDPFRVFNATFEELHRTQCMWKIPDPKLQSALQQRISKDLLPAYRSFLQRCT
ncbi:unnamed protein product [Closterium sp. NIES-64]|nr:unnamed protein product [Closterium sp. NIES-64]